MNQRDVYISYHYETSRFDAQVMAEYLERNGISCCIDFNEYGDSPLGTVNAISSCKVFMILLTMQAANSDHVLNEIDLAISKGKIILPILFDPKAMQVSAIRYYLGRYHCVSSYGTLSNIFLKDVLERLNKLLSAQTEEKKSAIVKAKPYSGDLDFIFVSYSHKNTDEVIKTILAMQQQGLRVWYDEGIDPGTEWDDFIAEQIERCGYMVAFISKEYLESNNCKDELNFARDLDKKRLLVYLEDVQLPRGMAMRLNRLQAIHMYKYNDHKDFVHKLLSADGINAFLD